MGERSLSEICEQREHPVCQCEQNSRARTGLVPPDRYRSYAFFVQDRKCCCNQEDEKGEAPKVDNQGFVKYHKIRYFLQHGSALNDNSSPHFRVDHTGIIIRPWPVKGQA